MTYCLSLKCHEGLVFLSDSRTSAGVDNVTIHSKMRVFELRGHRVFCLMSSGNLSITQSVISLIERDIRAGISFNSNFILGGQIEKHPPEIYQIYPEGNAIHASSESPFLQIGELKYGKPILDRVFTSRTTLAEAAKLGLLSLDATAKSNLSVGTPFEMLAYRVDSLEVRHRIKFEENDPYLRMVCDRWQEGLIQLVHNIPELDVLKQ
jgi:putative proteasome-type protease